MEYLREKNSERMLSANPTGAFPFRNWRDAIA